MWRHLIASRWHALSKNDPWFFFFTLFIIQLSTGILLSINYDPGNAFETTLNMEMDALFGLVRQVHIWSSSAMILWILIITIRQGIKSILLPRRSWWMVIGSGFLVLGACLTGAFLPLHQDGYWGGVITREVVERTMLIGDVLSPVLFGDGSIDDWVRRFYVIHTQVLPWILVAVLLMYVQSKKHLGKKEPDMYLRILELFYLSIAVVATLAILFPVDLGSQATPDMAPLQVKPHWYFLPFYQLAKSFSVFQMQFTFAFLAMLLFTWTHWRTKEYVPIRRILDFTGLATMSILAGLGLLGLCSNEFLQFGSYRLTFGDWGWPVHLTKTEEVSSAIVWGRVLGVMLLWSATVAVLVLLEKYRLRESLRSSDQ